MVQRQFRGWTLAELWEEIMDALNESGLVPAALQMIDSTVVRAHHQAAGAKGVTLPPTFIQRERDSGFELIRSPTLDRDRVLAPRLVASRPRSTSASTAQVCR